MSERPTLNRREMLAATATGIASLCTATLMASRQRALSVLPLRGGVSLAGAEFGCQSATFSNRSPGIYGRDYLYPSEQTIAWFIERGLGLLRIPVRWERLQPELGELLDATELERLREVVRLAGKHGGHVVIDLHNYGRYQFAIAGGRRTLVIDERVGGTIAVSREHFADFWRRIAQEFAGNPTLAACGLMNEPHDMGRSDWKRISQAAVDAIRSVDARVFVLVGGDGWSNAHRFGEVNGPKAWIDDPAGRTAYEAHCYFDADASGLYRLRYAEESSLDPALADRGVRRLLGFIEWCRRNDVPGFIGEIGIPVDQIGWHEVLRRALDTLEQNSLAACYWAAGDWWGDYPLSLQPRGAQPAPAFSLVQQYLARNS